MADKVNFCYWLINKSLRNIPRQRLLLAREMRVKSEDICNLDELAVNIEYLTGVNAAAIRDGALAYLSTRLREFDKADEALDWLALQDRRMAVWAACAVAEEALPYLSKREPRPKQLLAHIRNWVRGDKEEKVILKWNLQVLKAVYNASSPSARMAAQAANFTGLSVTIANDRTFPGLVARSTAKSIAYERPEKQDRIYEEALRRLVHTVADSMMNLPIEEHYVE